MARLYCMVQETLDFMSVISELSDAHDNDKFEISFGNVSPEILNAKSNAMFTVVISYDYYGKIITEHILVTGNFAVNADSIRESRIRNIKSYYRLEQKDLDWIITNNQWPQRNVPVGKTVDDVLNWYKHLE